jgi:hypothetical protein
VRFRYVIEVEAETVEEADTKLNKKLISAFETTQTYIDCFDVEESEEEGEIADAENN